MNAFRSWAVKPLMLRSLRTGGSGASGSDYMPGLDGLRAFAILSVLFCHDFEFGGTSSASPILHSIAFLAGHLGTAGVKLFFAISGYLICSRFAHELTLTNSRSALRSFYIRRAFRIIPPLLPYLGCLAIAAAFHLLPVHPAELLSAAFFYSNYVFHKSWFTLHFWSLSIEEHFYLMWAPLLAFAGRKWAARFAIAAILVTAAVRPLVVAHLSPQTTVFVLSQTQLQLDGFMFACLLALGMGSAKIRSAISRIALDWVVLFALGLLLISLFEKRSVPLLDFRSLQAALFATIATLPTLNPKMRITRFLELEPLVWIGRRSYGIYIWQEIIFIPSAALFTHKLLMFPVHVALVFAIAALSYRWLERPLMRKGRQLALDSQARNPMKNRESLEKAAPELATALGLSAEAGK